MAIAALLNRFGDRVADMVHSCSDTVVNTSAGQQKEDWHTRKTRYVEHLNLVDEDSLRVSLADKVHNARSILRDLRKQDVGQRVWDRFKSSKKDTLWYYGQLASAFQRRLKDRPARLQLAKELAELVEMLACEPAPPS